MSRILATGLLCLTIVSAVDATPRERRARKRAGRTQTTQQSRTNYNYYQPAQANTTASNPLVYSSAAQPTVVNSTPTEALQGVASYTPMYNGAATGTVQDSAPVVLASNAEFVPSEGVVSQVGTVATSDGTEVVQATATQSLPDVLPTVTPNATFTQQQQVMPATQTFNSALSELNGIRAQRGLPALIEDPSLSAIAHQKASIQANRGAMYHPGGTMGGARFEGVGMGPQFTTCYQNATNVTYAGAATVTGRNGQRYHCLLVK